MSTYSSKVKAYRKHGACGRSNWKNLYREQSQRFLLHSKNRPDVDGKADMKDGKGRQLLL